MTISQRRIPMLLLLLLLLLLLQKSYFQAFPMSVHLVHQIQASLIRPVSTTYQSKDGERMMTTRVLFLMVRLRKDVPRLARHSESGETGSREMYRLENGLRASNR